MANQLQQMRIITAEESMEIYGFAVGKQINITGMDLTAEKVELLMKEFIKTLKIRTRQPNEALIHFNKFKEFCKAKQAEVKFA